MFRSHIFIVATNDNPDHNSPQDIADAVKDCECSDLECSDNGVIQATVATNLIPEISLMTGVSYVRADVTYDAK